MTPALLSQYNRSASIPIPIGGPCPGPFATGRQMSVIKMIARSFLGQALGVGLFAGGFWLLFLGFLGPSIPLGILGGAMIPVGMWVMARVRRVQSTGNSEQVRSSEPKAWDPEAGNPDTGTP